MHNDNLKELTLRGDGVGGVDNGTVYRIKCLFRTESGDDLCIVYSCRSDFHGGAEIL